MGLIMMQEKGYIWIGNGTAVFHDRLVKNGSLLIKDGKIIDINCPCSGDFEKVDAHGGYILPGFIDVHVHGGGGADFTDAEPGCVKTAAREHGRHGTTAMVPTTMTCPDETLEKAIISYLRETKEPFEGPELLGLHLEGPFFATTGKSKGAQPVASLRIPTREVLEHFIKLAENTILRWDEAPELPNTELFAAVMRENGILVEVDDRNEKIGYKIREAQLEKVPYMLIIGEKEVEAGAVAVRSRREGDLGQIDKDEFITKIVSEIKNKVR